MKLVLAALAAAQLLAAGDFASDLFPANTKVVFGIRVPAIVDSGLFKDMGSDARKLAENWSKLVAIAGFDPLHDIDEILLAASADKENNSSLLVLRGRFDLARLGSGAPLYHGIAMVGGGKTGAGALALLDAATILTGDTAAVHAAIDRRGQGAVFDGVLQSRVQSLRERFDIWGTGERPEGFTPLTGKNEQLDSLDRFQFGVRISKGFELDAELHSRTPKDAEKLAASLQLMKMMMGGQDQLAPKLDVQVADGTLKISLEMSEEGVKKLMATRRVTGAPAGGPPVIVRSESTAPAGGPPVIVSSESSVPVPGSQSGGTTIVTLPGKK